MNAYDNGRTTIIQRMSADVLGMRIAIDEASALRAMAFLFAATGDIAATGELDTSGTYVLAGDQAAYCGETGHLARRLLDHAADQSKKFATQVFVVTGLERRLDKPTVIHLQARLTEMIEAKGLLRVQKGVTPCASDLPPWRKQSLDHMLTEACRLLFDAGFRGLDAPPPSVNEGGAGRQPQDEADDGDDTDDGQMEIGASVVPPMVQEFELVYSDLFARGYDAGSRFVVASGSELRVSTPGNGSLGELNRRRRQTLLDEAAEPIPGLQDRVRLTAAVAFPSRAIAAKCLSGIHLGTDRWRLLGRTPVIVTV
jgi:hypothetical protein